MHTPMECGPSTELQTVVSRVPRRSVPTGSTLALSAAIVKWQADSTALFGRLVEQSQALRGGAAASEQTDQQSAAAINAAADQTAVVDLGL